MKFTDRVVPEGNSPISILLVEDEAPVRLLMWHILEQAGYRVLLANDGVDAMRKLNEGAKIDLLLTDLEMPSMDGVDLGRQAGRLLPKLKILYTTGVRDRFPQLSEDAPCVTKPFTVSELLSAVSRILKPTEVLVKTISPESLELARPHY